MKKLRKITILILVIGLIPLEAFESITTKGGLGLYWDFFKYKPSIHDGFIDNANDISLLNLAVNFRPIKKLEFGIAYETGSSFCPDCQGTDFRITDLVLGFIPWDIYNELYINAGVSYIQLNYHGTTYSRLVPNLGFGVYVKFPYDIFLTIDVRGYITSFDSAPQESKVIGLTILALGYRFNFQKAPEYNSN